MKIELRESAFTACPSYFAVDASNGDRIPKDTLQAMVDFASEHMPPPKKSVEDFLAMDDEDRNNLINEFMGCRVERGWHKRHGRVWNEIRPEIRKRGYRVKVLPSVMSESVEFILCNANLDQGYKRIWSAQESENVTLPRFICACYLFVMQEEGAK